MSIISLSESETILPEPVVELIHPIEVLVGFRPEKMPCQRPSPTLKKVTLSKNTTNATSLPVILMYNMRSFFLKQNNFCDDFLEREADIAFLTEVWEKKENTRHKFKIEKIH